MEFSRPKLSWLSLLALLALACGGANGDPEVAIDESTASPSQPSADRASAPAPDAPPAATADAPAFLDDEKEVAMQALSVSSFAPSDASACGLPAPAGGEGALVYFGCTPSEGPIVRAAPARRLGRSGAGPSAPEAALRALLEGPSEEEKAQGYMSTFGAGTAEVDWSLGQRGDLAWVDFDGGILEVDGLFVSPMDASQIVATLGQFEGVEKVLILVDGEPLCRAQGEC